MSGRFSERPFVFEREAIAQIPQEHWGNLLQIIKLFQDSVSPKPEKAIDLFSYFGCPARFIWFYRVEWIRYLEGRDSPLIVG